MYGSLEPHIREQHDKYFSKPNTYKPPVNFKRIQEQNYAVSCLLKAKIVKPAETVVARERLCKHVHC
jgi:hypothetical protein